MYGILINGKLLSGTFATAQAAKQFIESIGAPRVPCTRQIVPLPGTW